MSDNTGIEWTDATWNPITGCTKVSPGCDHCYAETFAERFRGTPGHHFENGFDVTLRPERLEIPLRWKKPRRIFVNSMSDLFHDAVPDEFIVRVFDVMANARRHTFQVLTKRHARMRSFVTKYVAGEFGEVPGAPAVGVLPNVWLGVSAEDQHWYNIRWLALRETPAAVRFVSLEPLLDWVSLFANSTVDGYPMPDWVIVGGESGPGARPMQPAWARHLRNECTENGIPFLFKQWGAHEPRWTGDEPAVMHRVGKKAAGRELDGCTWDQYPEPVR